jgi:hypothetical protein
VSSPAASRLVRERLPAGAEAYFPVDAAGQLAEAAFPIVVCAAE